ncbi:MAG: hypothetical protein HPY52_12540 [Firmicutes bacterium]|nr:hypothetical protein [Bacillota bacterium]
MEKWGLDEVVDVLRGLYDSEIIVELYYIEWTDHGEVLEKILITRTLICLDEVAIDYKPGETSTGNIIEFPYITLFGEIIETSKGTTTTEITIPIDDEDMVGVDIDQDGELDISTGPFWEFHIIPTREPLRHRISDLIDKANKLREQGFDA